MRDNGLTVSVRTILQNAGNVPAVELVTDSKLFLVTAHHPEQEIVQAQDKLCDDLEKRARSDNTDMKTLFPGMDSYPRRRDFTSMRQKLTKLPVHLMARLLR